MRRFSLLVLALISLPGSSVPADQPLNEEEKKRLFLKAREEMTTVPYTPPAPTATPKPRPRVVDPTPPKPGPVALPPVKSPVSPPTPAPGKVTPPLRPPEETHAPIVVQKPGVAAADDEETPPAQKEPGFWARVFGGDSTNYKYLTPSIRRAIDRASVSKGRWRYIVVHNSGTKQGNAAAFEHYHRYVRHMPNGLAYHFVVGNGSGSKNGEIEIGNRWHRQLQGGHVHSDYLNNIALGICLVGDFNNTHPTEAQLEATEELINYLRRRVGRVGGQRAVIRPHKLINPPQWPTDCPGDEFPYRWFSRF